MNDYWKPENKGPMVAGLNLLKAFYLALSVSKSISRIYITSSMLVFDLPTPQLRRWAYFLSTHSTTRLTQLLDLVVYDRPHYLARFVLTYLLFSVTLQSRLRLRTAVSAVRPVPTVMDIFANANWCEREAMDMFGIRFIGHSDMRRILGDYGFWGFPCRVDFPTAGTFEIIFSKFFEHVMRLQYSYANTTDLNLLTTKQ